VAVAAGCGGSGSSSGSEGSMATTAPVTAPPSSGDHSIQEYGSEARGGEKEAAISAMHAFLTAVAGRDYAKVCTSLTSSSRGQLAQLAKLKHETATGCPALLAKLLSPTASSEAKRAARATISRVRVGEGNAFVLFRLPGGTVSYFVMKEEGGSWKATSLSAGTPLHP
jgi:hypothetical protein